MIKSWAYLLSGGHYEARERFAQQIRHYHRYGMRDIAAAPDNQRLHDLVTDIRVALEVRLAA